MRKIAFICFTLFLVACSSTPSWKGMSESEISSWKNIGVTVEQVAVYTKAKMSPDQVNEWFEQGFTNSKEIIAWASSNFSAEDASGWKSSGFNMEDAIDWAENKFTFAEAKEWRDAKFDLDDAISNRAKGLSPVQ